MRVILKAICLVFLGLTFVFTSHYVLAIKKKLSTENPENTKKEKSAENINIIRYPGSTAIALKAKQAIVTDYFTGKILLEKLAHEKMPPSSMTKMMTSYVIEEKLKKGEVSLDTTFLVSEKAWRIGGSKSFMPLGEQVKLEDILRGIIIQSGNDACVVAAEGLYGSEEEFVDVMNSTAQEMGMKNTHFVNSNGWYTENHYSTAYDLALLGSWLIKTHPEFYPIYREKNFTFGKDQKGKSITQGNRNPLLYKDLGCDGIKTGYTDEGGYGIVASFIDKDRRYIIVINGLSSMQERSDEAAKVVYWIKQNFVNKKFYSKGDVVDEVPVWLGVKNKVQLEVAEDIFGLVLRSEQKNNVDIKKNVPPSLSAPLRAGDVAGQMIITIDNERQETPLIVKESIEKVGYFRQIILYVTSLL
jgi:D-alanyl-D-alanine carboxypeptidase (penicillin-binding protein 5/6)